MKHTDFLALANPFAQDYALATAAADAIGPGVLHDWHIFSSLARAEAGAREVPSLYDSSYEAALPKSIAWLTGPIPVDFLFEETREQAKAAYRARCAEHFDADRAPAQTEDWHQTMAPSLASRAQNVARFLEVARELGEPANEFPAEFFTSLTREEFEEATRAITRLGETHALLREQVEGAGEEWDRARAQVREELPDEYSDIAVNTRALDTTSFPADLVEVMYTLVTTVPVGFLVEETRQAFLGAYEQEIRDLIEVRRAERAQREAAEAAQHQAYLRRTYAQLGAQLGVLGSGNVAVYSGCGGDHPGKA